MAKEAYIQELGRGEVGLEERVGRDETNVGDSVEQHPVGANVLTRGRLWEVCLKPHP